MSNLSEEMKFWNQHMGMRSCQPRYLHDSFHSLKTNDFMAFRSTYISSHLSPTQISNLAHQRVPSASQVLFLIPALDRSEVPGAFITASTKSTLNHCRVPATLTIREPHTIRTDMSSPTNAARSDVHTSTYPLTRCHARTPWYSRASTESNTTAEDSENTDDASSLALHAVDSLVIERRKRTRDASPSHHSDLQNKCNGKLQQEGEDLDVEGLGTLALRAVNSIDLIRQDSDRLKMGSARSRMSKRERIRAWFFGVWYHV
jgi:hypothetical protein